MRPSFAGLLVLAALLVPRAGHAQFRDQLFTLLPADSLPAPSLAVPPSASSVQPLRLVPDAEIQQGDNAHPLWLALGGAAGGTLGMMAGMGAGALLDGSADEDCIDFCFGPGLVGGALLGEAVGIALGVHLANGRRGSLSTGMLTSAGILTAGLLASYDATPGLILVIPVGQLIGAMTVESSTARRR